MTGACGFDLKWAWLSKLLFRFLLRLFIYFCDIRIKLNCKRCNIFRQKICISSDIMALFCDKMTDSAPGFTFRQGVSVLRQQDKRTRGEIIRIKNYAAVWYKRKACVKNLTTLADCALWLVEWVFFFSKLCVIMIFLVTGHGPKTWGKRWNVNLIIGNRTQTPFMSFEQLQSWR